MKGNNYICGADSSILILPGLCTINQTASHSFGNWITSGSPGVLSARDAAFLNIKIADTMTRKPLSKKLRFEIFKRDSFTCQYCGRKAPEIILQVDHITAVKHGGQNDPLNLTTSCFDCNSGKSDRKLSDKANLDVNRAQMEQLQERKNQIEMMLAWKKGLSELNDNHIDEAISYIDNKSLYFQMTDSKIKEVSGLIKKFGFIKVMEAADDSFLKYYKGTGNQENYEFTVNKIRSILQFNALPESEKEEYTKVGNLLKKLRAKYGDYNYIQATRAISAFTRKGYTADHANIICDYDSCYNFGKFLDEMYSYN